MSSGSRGPSSSRYNDRNEYPEYNKSRRKNFFSSGSSRRDYKSGSSTSGSKEPASISNANRSYKSNVGTTPSGNGGSGPNIRDSRSYISDQYSGPSKSSSYGSYYPSYGSYNTFASNSASKSSENGGYYNSRGDSWRSDRSKGNAGDSRLSSSNKPSYSSRSGLGSSGPPSSSSTADYRKDRYDSYTQPDVPPGSSSSKWKSTSLSSSAYNANKIPVSGNRGSLSNSVSRFSKDRVRGSSYNSGGGSSALVNSGVGSKRNSGDTYYPSSRDSLPSSHSSSKAVDRYSSNKHNSDTSNYPRSRNHSVEPEEGYGSKIKMEADHYSPNASNDEDDTNRMSEDEDDSRINNEVDENEPSKVSTREETDVKVDPIEQDEEDEDEDEEDEYEGQKTKVLSEFKALESVNEHANNKQNIFTKVDVSNEVCYQDGCTYPLGKIESEFEELQAEFTKNFTHSNGLSYLKYSLAKPVEDFQEYEFFSRNYKHFVDTRVHLVTQLKGNNDEIHQKRLALWREYSKGLKVWEDERLQMEQQLRLLHPPDDEMKREIEASDNRKHSQVYNIDSGSPDRSGSSGNRRNRRHGDLVTTEAEFQEILQSLGKENDEEPLIKAERVAAHIPDLILDPIERDQFKFMDANNFVTDKKAWANRVKTDFADNFSTKEHELFCEGFCFYPKRFGAISRHMGGLRTAQDCVIHYYVTKKAVNYKQLLAQHKKKMSKKAGRKSKSSRSRNVSQTQTPLVTPSEEKPPILAMEKEVEIALPEIAANDLKHTLEETNENKGGSIAETSEKYVEAEGEPVKKKSKTKEDIEKTPSVHVSPASQHIAKDEIEVPNPIVTTITEREPQLNGSVVEEPSSGAKVTVASPSQDESKERRRTISSYWSITEATLFPDLLQEHGTKWTTIADKLTTKTATMVRNYFQRNAEKNGWNEIARAADLRLDAKFAAVLSTKLEPDSDIKEAIPVSTQATPAEPLAPTAANSQAPTSTSSFIPYGTFQHGAQATGTHSSTPNPPRMGINSLLADSPVTQSVIQKPAPQSAEHDFLPNGDAHASSANAAKDPQQPQSSVAPQRSSIMSLLNSDSSPVKREPQVVAAIAPARQNKLHDILNSSTEPAASNGAHASISTNGVNDQTK